ncbi:unnamed protein product [Linum trigynum]|uniref:Uncharacterized protein n=1 Tax=Linum trigynum TaxID=586398 RepID=A0AAV2G6F0_9ROSI
MKWLCWVAQGMEGYQPFVGDHVPRPQTMDDRLHKRCVQDPPRLLELQCIDVGALKLLVLVRRKADGVEGLIVAEVIYVQPLRHGHVRGVEPHVLGEPIISQHMILTSQHKLHVQPVALARRDHMGEGRVELDIEHTVNELVNRQEVSPLGMNENPRHCFPAHEPGEQIQVQHLVSSCLAVPPLLEHGVVFLVVHQVVNVLMARINHLAKHQRHTPYMGTFINLKSMGEKRIPPHLRFH